MKLFFLFTVKNSIYYKFEGFSGRLNNFVFFLPLFVANQAKF